MEIMEKAVNQGPDSTKPGSSMESRKGSRRSPITVSISPALDIELWDGETLVVGRIANHDLPLVN